MVPHITQTNLHNEYHDQPAVANRIIANLSEIAEVAQHINMNDISTVAFAAAGSSHNVAIFGATLFAEKFGLLTSHLDLNSKVEKNLKNTLVVAISQSLGTPGITEIVEYAEKQGAKVILIHNNMGSDLVTNEAGKKIESDMRFSLYVYAHAERAVASTKSFIGCLIALYALVAHLVDDGGAMLKALAELPQAIRETISLSDRIVDKIGDFKDMERLSIIGNNYSKAIAYEGSTKIAELVFATSGAHSTKNYWHGPKALVESGYNCLLVVPSGSRINEDEDLIDKIHECKGDSLIISNVDSILDKATFAMPIVTASEEAANAIIATIPLQKFAYELAYIKNGADVVDNSRNNDKVTRK